MFTLADIDARRAKAALKLELRAKKTEAARAERAAREEDTRRRRAAQAETRAQRRAAVASGVAAVCRRILPALPVVMVSAFAVCGQVGAIFTYPPGGTPWAARVVIAIGAAVTLETIANYVAHQGHKALLAGATTEAARRRYAAYAVALLVAFIQYSHFSGAGLTPTPAALMFALFSAAQPWLWGLHTRRELHGLLVQQGRADTCGAVFAAERSRNFPIRTIKARRYSIDHGITDPQVAWEAYRLEMQRRRDDLPAAWRQLATSLLHLDVQQDTAEAAANLVSPIDVPELERVEDIAVPDPEQVDDNGLSLLWKTAPKAFAPTAESTRKPAARRNRSGFLADPPAKAVELARSTSGWVALRDAVLDELRLEITEYEAKKLRRRYLSTNGHKVTQP